MGLSAWSLQFKNKTKPSHKQKPFDLVILTKFRLPANAGTELFTHPANGIFTAPHTPVTSPHLNRKGTEKTFGLERAKSNLLERAF